MLVSIIIPVYNEQDKILMAINSCLEQQGIDKTDIEIIIADGNSTDKTVQIIKNVIRKNEQVKLVRNKYRFMPHGFNIALSTSRGKYVMVMSGHSELGIDYVKNCIKSMNKKKVMCVSGLMKTVQRSSTGKVISIALSTPFGIGNSRFRLPNKNGAFVDTGVFGFYNSKVFAEIGGMDEDLVKNQDEELNYRLIKHGYKIWLDPSIKSKYFSRDSFSKLFSQYFYYGFYKIRVFQKLGSIPSLRQVVPFSFVLAFLLSFLYVVISNNWSFILLLSISYFTANLGFSLFETLSRKNKVINVFKLSAVYFLIHISYGVGNIAGLFYFIDGWGSNMTSDKNFDREKFAENRS